MVCQYAAKKRAKFRLIISDRPLDVTNPEDKSMNASIGQSVTLAIMVQAVPNVTTHTWSMKGQDNILQYIGTGSIQV